MRISGEIQRDTRRSKTEDPGEIQRDLWKVQEDIDTETAVGDTEKSQAVSRRTGGNSERFSAENFPEFCNN
jgi:hypothetical protein